MRTRRMLHWLFAVMILQVGLFACRGEDSTALVHSMKGYELYSWQEDGNWRFALLVGTNRVKTYEEIIEAPDRVEGTEALLEQIGRLPRGEQVFWLEERVPGTSLPSQDVLQEVDDSCKRRGIQLEIVHSP